LRLYLRNLKGSPSQIKKFPKSLRHKMEVINKEFGTKLHHLGPKGTQGKEK